MNKIIVFGASGDLAKRKIMPAISKMCSKSIKVYGYARSDLVKTYSQEIKKFYDYSINTDIKSFPDRVTYIKGEYTDLSPLKDVMDENTVAYLSLPPHVYPSVLFELSSYKVGIILLEKPFGTGLESFKDLLKFKNDKIHFVDHYLLKPMMISIYDIYVKTPSIFAFLNKTNIQSVECLFFESILAEGRAYFDDNGMIKDVMQNHLVEVLASILCDHSQEILDESRTRFIKSIDIDNERYIFGQYKSYTEELKKPSKTETFAAFKCIVKNDTWENVPFFMAGGKGLKKKTTEIKFNIRKGIFCHILNLIANDADRKVFNSIKDSAVSISLVFNIAPENEIYLKIKTQNDNIKIVLYTSNEIKEISKMKTNNRQDYELIFQCMINGDYFPSVSFEEAGELWRVFGNILNAPKPLIYYEQGVEMPEEVYEFFKGVD
ncbi:uncharacterized protein VICG_01523 [Vittaforma corneae ATCC 50505]|uniref:Glucose-6-phosphate 1-dehydrogenase n=1 Tax=Vittaforma corneae (strain ATCC 50505) TaxID=993615 RepID=L2GKK7_VITCO|nr:uncharacterized protein VICG_01523 [Vittaforma corneae ATCC 50505]ELA41418.1 hypothetical protein VICG_01523 [Vittaforma corneae ATCC 50505]